jgi:hypothetical protein
MAIGDTVATGKASVFLISLNYFSTIKKMGHLRDPLSLSAGSGRVPWRAGLKRRWQAFFYL